MHRRPVAGLFVSDPEGGLHYTFMQAGKPDPASMTYLEKIDAGKKLFLFATHGAAPDSDHVRNAFDVAKGLAPNAEIAGVFSCQGEVDPGVLEKVRSKPRPPVWIADAPFAAGHPDDQDIQNLRTVLSGL